MGRHALPPESPRTTVSTAPRSETAARIGEAFARSVVGEAPRHSWIALGSKAISVADLLQKYGNPTAETGTEHIAAPTQQISQEIAPVEPHTMRLEAQKTVPVKVAAIEPASTEPSEFLSVSSSYNETPQEVEPLALISDFPSAEQHMKELPLLTHDIEQWATSYSGANDQETVESWRLMTAEAELIVGELVVGSVASVDTGIDTIPPITLPLVHA
ncbi:MAG TPA: hypothetical protein VLG11_01110 [Candidatus Saccharimonadales bacterium]|nr:hypothetical protein [Candidatus Saccharimonadales bacterium]